MTNLLILLYITTSLSILLYSFIYKDTIDGMDEFDFTLLSGIVAFLWPIVLLWWVFRK